MNAERFVCIAEESGSCCNEWVECSQDKDHVVAEEVVYHVLARYSDVCSAALVGFVWFGSGGALPFQDPLSS